mgnify:CR=1 FL=1
MNFEQRVREDLLTYLAGRQEIDVPMPECPDVEEAWRKVGEDYMPDGIREFNAYPTVSLAQWSAQAVSTAVILSWSCDTPYGATVQPCQPDRVGGCRRYRRGKPRRCQE